METTAEKKFLAFTLQVVTVRRKKHQKYFMISLQLMNRFWRFFFSNVPDIDVRKFFAEIFWRAHTSKALLGAHFRAHGFPN